MADIRKIQGEIVLPPDAPHGSGRHVSLEVRDVTQLDAPSFVIARKELPDVSLSPYGTLPFEIDVPEVDAGRALSLRVHISQDGSTQVKQGDLITTSSCAIAPTGATAPVFVAPKLV